MKIRRDFVTNSSSSSFIIGKEGDNTNIDIIVNYPRLKSRASDCQGSHLFSYLTSLI